MNFFKKLFYKLKDIELNDEEIEARLEYTQPKVILPHELDGLYYSHLTGTIFETEVIHGVVYVKYVEGENHLDKPIFVGDFYIQYAMDCYDRLFSYKELELE